MHEGFEEDGTGGSGHILVNYECESSVVMTGLSLEPRGSGAVNTVAASGNPSFAGPPLALEKGVRLGACHVRANLINLLAKLSSDYSNGGTYSRRMYLKLVS